MKLILWGSSRPLRAQAKNHDRRPSGSKGCSPSNTHTLTPLHGFMQVIRCSQNCPLRWKKWWIRVKNLNSMENQNWIWLNCFQFLWPAKMWATTGRRDDCLFKSDTLFSLRSRCNENESTPYEYHWLILDLSFVSASLCTWWWCCLATMENSRRKILCLNIRYWD